MCENPMADSMFGLLSKLESRTVGEASGVWGFPDESVSTGRVSFSSSPPSGLSEFFLNLSEFFLKRMKSAAAEKFSRSLYPDSETRWTLSASEGTPERDLESQLLFSSAIPAPNWMVPERSTPSHITAPRKAGRELAHRNARNNSDPRSHK